MMIFFGIILTIALLAFIILQVIRYLEQREFNDMIYYVLSKNDKKEQEKDSKNIFMNGNQNMLFLVQIALYKLSEEGNLFGFEEIIKSVKEELIKFDINAQEFNNWKNKYVEYSNKLVNQEANQKISDENEENDKYGDI